MYNIIQSRAAKGLCYKCHGFLATYYNLAELHCISPPIFSGYTDDDQEGDTVVVNNLHGTKPRLKNFETTADLYEAIESMYCSCQY